MRLAVCFVQGLLLMLPAFVLADSANAPATAPATQPAYKLIMPAGMEMVTVGSGTAICPPHYTELVRKGLAQLQPATRPTTMASDILANLAASRGTVQAQIAADFNIPADQVGAFLDGSLKDSLEKVERFHNRIFIIVATQEEMTRVMKTGWHAPLFHYNPLDDHTFYNPSFSLTDAPEQNDLVLWDEVTHGESDADIVDGMNQQLHGFQNVFLEVAGQVAVKEERREFIHFISEKVIKPLNIPSTEDWFNYGVLGAMSSKYAAILTGVSRSAMAAAFSGDSSSNPIQSAPLDLLHEFDSAVIKAQFRPYYLDAVSRKGTAVVEKLVERAGDGCVMKIVNAMRARMPADSVALVALIKEQTGVDLTDDLLPGK
jgi:hypothetical protein